MKNYIRTCLSLDKKTIDRIANIAKIMGTSKSEAIRTAIIHFYYGITTMVKEEEK